MLHLQLMGVFVEAYYNLLLESPLFKALNVGELPQMLECLDARVRSFTSKQYIIHENDVTEDIGVVLEGKIQINNIDAMGNRSLTGKRGVGEVFGQVVAANLSATNPVSVVADTDCQILLLKFHKLVAPCSRACSFHSRVIENMMSVLAEKNLMMNRKLSILSQRSIREKLLTFLSWQYQDKKSNKFSIPFNRDELADYLCVNRSALSREISSMVNEGLITTHRNNFIIHQKLEFI